MNSQLWRLAALLQTLPAGVPVVQLGRIWAAAVLFQLLHLLLYDGCSELAGCAAVVDAAVVVYFDAVVAAGPPGYPHAQKLDVSPTVPDRTAAGQHGSVEAAAAVS